MLGREWKSELNAYRSEASIKTLGFTFKYFPFPHPMSRPTEPGGRLRRNWDTLGQGFGRG